MVRDLGALSEDGLSARALLSRIRRRRLPIVLALTLSVCALGADRPRPTRVVRGRRSRGHPCAATLSRSVRNSQTVPPIVCHSKRSRSPSISVSDRAGRSLAQMAEAPEFQEMEYPKGRNWEIVEARLGDIWQHIPGLASVPKRNSHEHSNLSTLSDPAALRLAAPRRQRKRK